MMCGCMNEKNDHFSDRIKAMMPTQKTLKSVMELVMIATAILTLALL